MKKKIQVNNKLILFSAFLGIVLLKASLIHYFPSPWIFSDEQSYFGMAGKIIKGLFFSITNSHMPGYSLLIALTMLMPTIELSYKLILLFNIILSSSVIFTSFILFTKVFKLKQKESIIYSILISLLPQFILYNYTVMSENLYTILFFTIVVLLFLVFDDLYINKVWLWVLLGSMIGFSPIVRSQSLILLFMFMLFCLINLLPRIRIVPPVNYIILICSSIVTYSIFKFIIFTNTGSYPGQLKGYFDALENASKSIPAALTLVQILFGEFSYLFAALIFVPTFAAVLYFIRKDIKREYKYLFYFLLLFITANVLLTTLHANSVFYSLNLKTVYARYLDFTIPVLFALGIIGIKDFASLKNQFGEKIYFIYIISLTFIIIVFFYKQNLFVNTFTIYFYQFTGDVFGRLILAVLALAALVGLVYNKSRIVIVCVSLCLLISITPALSRQIKFSNDTFNLYAPIGYWFDKNNVRNSTIAIDNQITSYSGDSNNEKYLENNKLDYISFYSLLFWSNFYNKVTTEDINLNKNYYFVSSRLLPRKILASSGRFLLYDKTPQLVVELPPDMLSRFGKGFNAPEQDWIWMNENGRAVFDNVLIKDINQIVVEIELKGYYPPDLDKDIEVFINGISTGIQKGKENKFYFIMENEEKFTVNSIEIRSKTWDTSTNKYAQSGEGLGLDIKKLNLYLNVDKNLRENISYHISDKLIPWKVLDNTGKVQFYEKIFAPNLIITPEMLSRYGTGFNGREEDWNWITGNGEAKLDQIFFPDIAKAEIIIDLKGLWPEYLEKKVKVFVNDEKIGQQNSKGNHFVFKTEKSDRFDIRSIKIKSNT